MPAIHAAKALGVSLEAFRAGTARANLETTEWHHVGKFANRVEFWDTEELEHAPLFWAGCGVAYARGASKRRWLAEQTRKAYRSKKEAAKAFDRRLFHSRMQRNMGEGPFCDWLRRAQESSVASAANLRARFRRLAHEHRYPAIARKCCAVFVTRVRLLRVHTLEAHRRILDEAVKAEAQRVMQHRWDARLNASANERWRADQAAQQVRRDTTMRLFAHVRQQLGIEGKRLIIYGRDGTALRYVAPGHSMLHRTHPDGMLSKKIKDMTNADVRVWVQEQSKLPWPPPTPPSPSC